MKKIEKGHDYITQNGNCISQFDPELIAKKLDEVIDTLNKTDVEVIVGTFDAKLNEFGKVIKELNTEKQKSQIELIEYLTQQIMFKLEKSVKELVVEALTSGDK